MNIDQQISERPPHWSLSNVYTSLDSNELSQGFVELKTKLDDRDEYISMCGMDRQLEKPQSGWDGDAARAGIDGFLERTNAVLRLQDTLRAYIWSFVTTDSFNETAKRLYSELEMLSVRLQQQQVRFRGWLGGMAPVLTEILQRDGLAKEHSFYLKETVDQSRYMMSEPEESLAAELSLSGANAWSKLQGTVCSQLAVPFEFGTDSEKEVKRLPITVLQNLKYSQDPEVRRRSYEAELAAWDTAKEPLVAALNGIKGSVVTLNKRRGRLDALHEALDQGRIDRETLETMLGVMQDSFPIFRQYLKTKAKRLGWEALPWWDLFAPVGKLERKYTFSEARDFILTQFGKFSPRLAALARRAFENNWIDAEPRVGKRGGGFCMYVPLVQESRILVNFDGSLDSIFTVAHELGHAYNNECAAGKTGLQRIYPMTLAETASTFCETLVTNAALADASSVEEELAILETFLIGATQIIVDISSRFLFEKEVFERREKAELSADELCEIMLRSQEATYGDGLDNRYLHKYMWTWKPHYYRSSLSFYNFPYAFGLLFGTGLYAIYREKGAAFVPDYETLLARTGEGMAADLALHFGIDIRKPAFWEGSVKIIEGHVRRYTQL